MYLRNIQTGMNFVIYYTHAIKYIYEHLKKIFIIFLIFFQRGEVEDIIKMLTSDTNKVIYLFIISMYIYVMYE